MRNIWFVSSRSFKMREKLSCLSLYIFWGQSHLCLLLQNTTAPTRRVAMKLFFAISVELWAKPGSRGMLQNIIWVYNKIKTFANICTYQYTYVDVYIVYGDGSIMMESFTFLLLRFIPTPMSIPKFRVHKTHKLVPMAS